MMKNKLATFVALISTMMIVIPVMTVKAEETFVWGANVPSSGEPVTSPVLEVGVQYRIVAKEAFFYDYPNLLSADAQYYTEDPVVWDWVTALPAPDGHSFLQIDGMDKNWGPFSNGDTGHTYSIYYMGTDAPITFTLVDWIDGDCNNNQCHLPVEIYAVHRYYGLTPGFWKNHPEYWPADRDPSDSLRSVFGTCAPDVTLMEALGLKGGRRLTGARDILAREAVAALLNAETFGTGYPYTVGQLISDVSFLFCYGTREAMIDFSDDLDYWNNMGRPLSWP